MVAVYYKGCWHQAFNSLSEAEKYIDEQLESGGNEDDWSYMFY